MIKMTMEDYKRAMNDVRRSSYLDETVFENERPMEEIERNFHYNVGFNVGFDFIAERFGIDMDT